MPADKKSVAALQQKINSLATIDTSLLKQQLEERKKKPALAVVAKNNVVLKRLAQISNANDHILPLMQQQLKLKAYSASTVKTYINEMAQLLQMLDNIPADELKPAHLKRYLVYCYEKLALKENTLHSRINAFYPVGFKSKQYVLLCLCSAERNRWSVLYRLFI